MYVPALKSSIKIKVTGGLLPFDKFFFCLFAGFTIDLKNYIKTCKIG